MLFPDGMSTPTQLAPDGLSRRSILHLSAVAAGAALLAGCSGGGQDESPDQPAAGEEKTGTGKGSETKPLELPKRFGESPKLAELVKAGQLPKVADRLPDKPYVVPHRWLTTGKYGGTLNLTQTANDPQYALNQNMYGHSILRYLNDGKDIGPGLAESWSSNSDASEWTFHFRKGLKWSDGEPWSTADIMYWWEDLVLNTEHTATPPDDVRSGRDTTAKVTAPDETTLVLTFDAPAPITAEKLAAYVNSSGSVGPWWMLPKHYISQFHPKYNKKVTSRTWYEKHDQMATWVLNPACPTMCGWRSKSYEEGRSVVFERNPFYWVVDPKGNQLPYIDELNFELITDEQVQKTKFVAGAFDFVQGYVHGPLPLSDVQLLRREQERTGVEQFFWDSGTGSGSLLMWNHDYPDDELRTLFRDKRFRQALSYAYDRADVRKAIYYNSGELTTGTLSKKGTSFVGSKEGMRRYVEWRDSYVTHDPGKAKALLDELGVVDKNGDGKRELPSGKKLLLTLDHSAIAAEEHKEKNRHIVADWAKVGIAAQLNPISADSFGERWDRGELMIKSDWEIGDNQPLIYAGWVVPVEPAHWAPLHGNAYQQKVANPGIFAKQAKLSPWKRTPPWMLPDSDDDPIARLWELYAKARIEIDPVRRTSLLWDIFKVHVEEGPFLLGVVSNTPRIVLAHKDLRNVPRKANLALGGWTNPWFLPSPAAYDPESFFWNNPADHTD
ncbi:ABC transporter substrate-binding protein [Flindersiella endophytica]